MARAGRALGEQDRDVRLRDYDLAFLRQDVGIALGQGDDLFLGQCRGEHREVVDDARDAVGAGLVAADVEEVEVRRKHQGVVALVEQYAVDPDALVALVLDEDIVVPFGPFVVRINHTVDALGGAATAARRVEVDVQVAPRNVSLDASEAIVGTR